MKRMLLKGLLNRLGAIASCTASCSHEDLMEDVEPAAHARDATVLMRDEHKGSPVDEVSQVVHNMLKRV